MRRSVRRLSSLSGFLAVGMGILMLASAIAVAAEPLSGDQIRELVAGNTVQGSMQSMGPYTEYYQADGTIKGKDYTGKWTIEGNTMCFVYKAEDPKECWGVSVANGEVSWINAKGAVDGTGTVLKGNPNNF